MHRTAQLLQSCLAQRCCVGAVHTHHHQHRHILHSVRNQPLYRTNYFTFTVQRRGQSGAPSPPAPPSAPSAPPPSTPSTPTPPEETPTPRTEKAGLKPEQEVLGATAVVALFYSGCALAGGLLLYYFLFDKMVVAYQIYTAPYDVQEVATSLATLNTKYGCAPLLLRLSWQACALYDQSDRSGKNTGYLADLDAPYSKLPGNRGLDRAIKLLTPIKETYPNISWADLIVLAGVVSLEELGGPRVGFKYGRTDAPLDISLKEAVTRIPDHRKGMGHVKNVFYRLGFARGEMVALMGGHTVGSSHKQFSGFSGKRTDTPFVFNSAYFVELLDGKWKLEGRNGEGAAMHSGDLTYLPVDVALTRDEKMQTFVKRFASDEIVFHQVFATAFERLTELGYDHLSSSCWRAGSESRT